MFDPETEVDIQFPEDESMESIISRHNNMIEDARYADELPERDYYEGDSPDY